MRTTRIDQHSTNLLKQCLPLCKSFHSELELQFYSLKRLVNHPHVLSALEQQRCLGFLRRSSDGMLKIFSIFGAAKRDFFVAQLSGGEAAAKPSPLQGSFS